jgi:hypothetical protein
VEDPRGRTRWGVHANDELPLRQVVNPEPGRRSQAVRGGDLHGRGNGHQAVFHHGCGLVRGDDGCAGILGRVAGIGPPDDDPVRVGDAGVEELIAVDQDTAFLGMVRTIDLKRGIDQQVVLEGHPQATVRTADHHRYAAEDVTVHHVHVSVQPDIAGAPVVDQDIAGDDAVELPIRRDLASRLLGGPVVDGMPVDPAPGFDQDLVVDDVVIAGPVCRETETDSVAVLHTQGAALDAAGMAEDLHHVAAEIPREVAVQDLDGRTVRHDGHELAVLDVAVGHLHIARCRVVNPCRIPVSRGIDDLDAVASVPLGSLPDPWHLVLSVAVDIQVPHRDVVEVSLDPDHIDVGQAVLQEQAGGAPFSGQQDVAARDHDAAERSRYSADAVGTAGQMHAAAVLRQVCDGRVDDDVVIPAGANDIGRLLQMVGRVGGGHHHRRRAHGCDGFLTGYGRFGRRRPHRYGRLHGGQSRHYAPLHRFHVPRSSLVQHRIPDTTDDGCTLDSGLHPTLLLSFCSHHASPG